MARNLVDLAWSEEGDLVLGKGNDFAVVTNAPYEAQIARIRLMVTDPEWQDFQANEIGANMEDLLGLPNTPETARMGIRQITECLTRDGLFQEEQIFIKPIPTSKYIIQFFVFIYSEYASEPIGFQLSFNLESGVMVRSA